jgi:putative ABC transport system ATP-binding protein
MDLLMRLAEERGTTLVLITHDPELAARCDTVVTMRDGKIVTAASSR